MLSTRSFEAFTVFGRSIEFWSFISLWSRNLDCLGSSKKDACWWINSVFQVIIRLQTAWKTANQILDYRSLIQLPTFAFLPINPKNFLVFESDAMNKRSSFEFQRVLESEPLIQDQVEWPAARKMRKRNVQRNVHPQKEKGRLFSKRERERVKIARHSSPFIFLIIDYLSLTKLLSIPKHSATDCISLALGAYPSSYSC